MTTYSQYDSTSNIVSTDVNGNNQLTFTCTGISSAAVRYTAGNSGGGTRNIAFNIPGGNHANVHVWRDDGAGYPGYFSHSSNGPWSLEAADAAVIWMADTSSGGNERKFDSPQWQYSSANSSGPSVTQSRSAHSGTITNTLDNTLSAPNPGVFYQKTGQHRFQIKFFDQTDGISGYNVTIAWQTSSGTVSDTQSISTASGDLQLTYDFSANSTSDQPVTGAITVSFDVGMYYNGTYYVAGNTVLTFQYYSVGPYTASFSPASGIPGQSITVNIEDDNPYPDASSTLQFEQTPGGSLISATLSNANNYSLSINGAFTSQVGTYKIYDSDNNVVATATYAEAPTRRGGNGYPDRYPLIMTNLFARQRSIYSIGMTHKDTWDLFL